MIDINELLYEVQQKNPEMLEDKEIKNFIDGIEILGIKIMRRLDEIAEV